MNLIEAVTRLDYLNKHKEELIKKGADDYLEKHEKEIKEAKQKIVEDITPYLTALENTLKEDKKQC